MCLSSYILNLIINFNSLHAVFMIIIALIQCETCGKQACVEMAKIIGYLQNTNQKKEKNCIKISFVKWAILKFPNRIISIHHDNAYTYVPQCIYAYLYIFICIYTVCTIIIHFVMQRNTFIRFRSRCQYCQNAIIVFDQNLIRCSFVLQNV